MDDVDDSIQAVFEKDITQQINGPKGAYLPGHEFQISVHEDLNRKPVKTRPRKQDSGYQTDSIHQTSQV